MDPIIISVAPNGARKKKPDHPAIPLTPEELGVCARYCAKAGAALIHLHIRDLKTHEHTLDVGIYRDAIAAIKQQAGNDIIVQVTSESVGIYQPEEQMATVRVLKPEAVSLAIREIIPTPAHEEVAARFFRDVVDQGTHPQYILYSPDEVRYFADLKKRKVVPEGQSFILMVLGRKHAAAADASAFAKPNDLMPFLEAYSDVLKLSENPWAICSFGGNENACMLKAAECGGHVRIGFENNHWMKDGSVAPDNAALIAQFAADVTKDGLRTVANAAQARKFLKIA